MKALHCIMLSFLGMVLMSCTPVYYKNTCGGVNRCSYGCNSGWSCQSYYCRQNACQVLPYNRTCDLPDEDDNPRGGAFPYMGCTNCTNSVGFGNIGSANFVPLNRPASCPDLAMIDNSAFTYYHHSYKGG